MGLLHSTVKEMLPMSTILHPSLLTRSFRARGTTEDADAIVLFFEGIHVGRVPSHEAEEWLLPVALDGFTAHNVRHATDGADTHRDVPRPGIRRLQNIGCEDMWHHVRL